MNKNRASSDESCANCFHLNPEPFLDFRDDMPSGYGQADERRSGAFRDNQALRTLFTLPSVKQADSSALTLPELPPQDIVTGDEEVDAVLWLRSVISTGQAPLIEKAMLAAKRIKTPLKELEQRYLDILAAQSPGNWTVGFAAIGFSDLDSLAERSVQKLNRQHEAISRFGSIDALFDKTPAEQFCMDAMKRLKFDVYADEDHAKIDKRFQARPDLMPQTLSDCLHEIAYWNDLYWLRHAAHKDAGDHWPEAQARDCFVFRCLSRIKPRTKQESIAVFRYLTEGEHLDDSEFEAIMLNLLG